MRLPVLVLVVSAIMIPIEWRPIGRAKLTFQPFADDVVENIIGFVPVGMVLAEFGLRRGLLLAALLSSVAEASQFAMEYRDPSVIDVVSNVTGALFGLLLSLRWGIRTPQLKLNRRNGAIAIALACAIFVQEWASSGGPLNVRGLTAPGVLETHWTFDESVGRAAQDASGHGVAGKFRGSPKHVTGATGGAVQLDGEGDYIQFGNSPRLRLAGSMTITAWINSSAYPKDDAAIVSQRTEFGYQLDTTVDKGPRTIGFKLTNTCGEFIARYGATPLALGRWYHVAGVYNAAARTLEVYLNGKPDNGFLLGPVTGSQHSSRSPVYVGRRPGDSLFDFAGSIDNVRIYSFALTSRQIEAGMRGNGVDEGKGLAAGIAGINPGTSCAILSDQEDAKLPWMAAGFGLLAAFALLAFWPAAGPLLSLGLSLASGLLLLPALPSTLPLFSRWSMPLVALAGGASVILSARRTKRS